MQEGESNGRADWEESRRAELGRSERKQSTNKVKVVKKEMNPKQFSGMDINYRAPDVTFSLASDHQGGEIAAACHSSLPFLSPPLLSFDL